MVGTYERASCRLFKAAVDCSDCQYRPIDHPAMRGIGHLSAVGDASGAAVPSGTVLSWSGSWPDTKFQLKTPDAVQAKIQSVLAQKWGIVIDSQWHGQSDYFNLSGTQTMTLQVHTVSDYGAPDDIRSIIDGEIYSAFQVMPISQIRVVQAVSPSAAIAAATTQLPPSTQAAVAAAQAGYQDAVARGDSASASQFAAQIQQLTGTNPMGGGAGLTQWLAANWGWLAAGVIGLLVVKEVA